MVLGGTSNKMAQITPKIVQVNICKIANLIGSFLFAKYPNKAICPAKPMSHPMPSTSPIPIEKPDSLDKLRKAKPTTAMTLETRLYFLIFSLKQTSTIKGTIITFKAVKKAKARVHGRKPRVLILMGLPGANYMILTNRSYLGDLVRIAGGENIYHSDSQIYLSPSNDSLATKNPDVILRLEHALPNVTLPQFKQEFKKNSVWKTMKAVKTGRVYDLQQPDFNASANMNVSQALNKLSNWLYPGK